MAKITGYAYGYTVFGKHKFMTYDYNAGQGPSEVRNCYIQAD